MTRDRSSQDPAGELAKGTPQRVKRNDTATCIRRDPPQSRFLAAGAALSQERIRAAGHGYLCLSSAV